jgi:hypothetical protein
MPRKAISSTTVAARTCTLGLSERIALANVPTALRHNRCNSVTAWSTASRRASR